MALKTTQFITTIFDRCDDDHDWALPEGHILYSWRWVTKAECEGLELDRNEVLAEVQHGTLADIAESIGIEYYPAEAN